MPNKLKGLTTVAFVAKLSVLARNERLYSGPVETRNWRMKTKISFFERQCRQCDYQFDPA
ncbi:hypothetical protein ATY75_00100 [Rhizobium sp. N122]|nr:hypothetical protein ATY75_00100 [Rhizobium sp. N122]